MRKTGIWRRTVFLAAFVSAGLFAGCGTSRKVSTAGSGGSPDAGATGGRTGGGGTGGGGAPGSGGQAGVGQATGGAAGSVAGAGSGGASGTVGADGGSPDGGGTGGVGAGAGGAGHGGGGGKTMVVEPYFHAGTRLKPRVFRAAGLEVLDAGLETYWYDVKTGDQCMFRVGADGIERCFPAVTLAEDDQQELSYLDAACTRPAIRGAVPSCDGTTPQHLTFQPASGCNLQTYRYGTAKASNTPLYGKGGGSCRRLPAPTEALPVIPLEEVPADTFVAMKRVSRPRHPRMNAWVREGEDGSSEIIGFSDPARDAPCFAVGLVISPPHLCVPAWAEAGGAFSDAACTQRVGFDPAPRCSARTATVLLERTAIADSCPAAQSIKLWQSAGVHSTQVFDDTSNGGCQLRSPERVEFPVQGEPIDLASLPRLDVILVGDGPLKLAFYGFDGTPFLPATTGRAESTIAPGPFLDVARGEPCVPRLFADGAWRCVPSSFQAVMDFNLYYESMDCTGARAHIPSGYCEDAKRLPRGVVVETLKSVQCQVPIVDTLELEGQSTSTWASMHPLNTLPCESRVLPEGMKLLKVKGSLNPAELFVPMERVSKE